MGDDPEGNVAHHFAGALVVAPGRQEPRTVWLLLKNGARIFQGYKLGLTPVHSAVAKFTRLFQENQRVGTSAFVHCLLAGR